MTPMTTGAARAGRAVREALLTLAALGGVICIVLTVLAFTGGYTLIMFKTGSMSPTIPAGSVALVQRIPASDVAVGDVVTVDRANALPVTHRVTSVSPGDSDAERIITMQGDANETEDPAPYTVTDVRIVRGSLPHLANVIVGFGNPLVLGGLTIGASVLVTWAFWPKEGRLRRLDEQSSSDDAVQESPEPPAAPQSRRERRAAGILGVAALVATAAIPLTSPAAAEAAGALSLTSNLSGTQILDAVDPLNWHVDIDATAVPEDGTLTIALAGAEATAGMRIVAEIRSCAVPWTDLGCPAGEQLLRAVDAVDLDGRWERILSAPTPGATHLQVALTAPSNGAAESASLTIRADAGGESAEQHLNGEGELPRTGGASYGLYAAPAAVLVGLGIALIARTRRGRT